MRESQGAGARTRGGDSLGVACGHQMFTCNKKKGEGVEGQKGEGKKGWGLQGWAWNQSLKHELRTQLNNTTFMKTVLH